MLQGAGYALYVAIMAEITEAEKDGLLGLFSGRKWTRTQIMWWWQHRTGSTPRARDEARYRLPS